MCAQPVVAYSHTPNSTLRLDRLPKPYKSQVPASWDGSNYDYSWIVTFKGSQPVTFEMVLQDFQSPFSGLPHNLWGEPE